jgi:hypothetical protein
VLPDGVARLVAGVVREGGDGFEPVPLDLPAPMPVVRAGLAALLEARATGQVPLVELVRAARALDDRGPGTANG